MAPNPQDEQMLAAVSSNRDGPLTFHKQKVMVKITAPQMKTKTADLDIVAVMDISGSMQGTKLDSMKKAMEHVIGILKGTDRLAVVAFNSIVDRRIIKPSLDDMDDANQKFLKGKIKQLTAGGGTNIRAALEEAITILKGRELNNSEYKTRAACIFLMSDGEQNEGGDARTILGIPDVTVHTFGFGGNHDELVLWEIAYRSNSGVYSNVPENMMLPMSAKLALCRSVTALDVKVTLTPIIAAAAEQPKVQVGTKEQKVGSISVDAGYYIVTDGSRVNKGVEEGRGSRVIRFGDLARDEIRRIIVDIPLHGVTDAIKNPEKVLKVECSYRLPRQAPSDRPVTVHVELARAEDVNQYAMQPDVKRELVRRDQAEYLRMVKKWTDQGMNYLDEAQREVDKARQALKLYFKETDDIDLRGELHQELGNLELLLTPKANDKEYIKLCRAYLLACLSSHGRQRFAGRGGKQGEKWFYVTPRMDKYIKEAKEMINKSP